MTEPEFEATRACVFDAYGTLFDVHSAVGRHAAALGEDATAFSALWRHKQLEYAWLRSLMEAYADFWQVTTDALDFALARFGVTDEHVRESLLDAYRELDAYPEVQSVLEELQRGGFDLAILSNGTPEMLASALAAAGLEQRISTALSAQELRLFKPRREVYALAVERLGLSPREICFLSSNAWDVHGAAHFGFRCVWVNRFGQPPEALPAGPVAVIETLEALPELLPHG